MSEVLVENKTQHISSRLNVGLLYGFLLIVTIAGGLSIRVAMGSNVVLWNDEAETTINALQVLDVGFPHGTFEGKPLYENASFIPSQDPKYAYESTNYYGGTLERNKGWLPYYYQAAFLKIFGFNTFSARAPFMIVFVATALVLYWFGSELYGRRTGLIAVVFHAFNYYAFVFEYQARYYSLLILFSLVCLFIFFRTLRHPSWRNYLFSACAITALFFTHSIGGIVAGVFFFFAHIFFRMFSSSRSKKMCITLLLPIVVGGTWLVLVKFWNTFGLYEGGSERLYKFALVFLLIICGWIGVRIFSYFGYSLRTFHPTPFLVLFFLISLVVKIIAIPPESLSFRLFIDFMPVGALLLSAVCVHVPSVYRVHKLRAMALATTSVILLIWVFGMVYQFGLGDLGIYQPDWVVAGIHFLEQHDVKPDTLVLVTDQQMPFQLYSPYNVDLVWPLRKEYIDTYPGTFYFIYHAEFLYMKRFYSEEILDHIQSENGLNYYDRVSSCRNERIYPHTYVFTCTAPEIVAQRAL
ncbi:MAG: glycosyltransferase family 39 protein [Patescibacteria group bacterium]|jgi:hypothetical protein